MRQPPEDILAQNIIRHRHALGWSQEKLADATGLHRTYIGAVERKERNPSLRTISRIADALSTTASSLLQAIIPERGVEPSTVPDKEAGVLDVAPLSPYQRGLVTLLIRAFSTPVDCWINPRSTIVTGSFEKAFRSRLLFHHTMVDEPLNKKSFEYAFRDALNASGRHAVLVPSMTIQGLDIEADGERISLKTESSKAIHRDSIHISKLMEARWIRDCHQSRETLVEMIRAHVLRHFSNYDRVLTLRVFRLTDDEGDTALEYSLVEIPKDVLEAVGTLTTEDFEPINHLNATKATVVYAGQRAFTFVIDGSDEKITLRNIALRLCFPHAWWKIPLSNAH